jgi:hypothetical protein
MKGNALGGENFGSHMTGSRLIRWVAKTSLTVCFNCLNKKLFMKFAMDFCEYFFNLSMKYSENMSLRKNIYETQRNIF